MSILLSLGRKCWNIPVYVVLCKVAAVSLTGHFEAMESYLLADLNIRHVAKLHVLNSLLCVILTNNNSNIRIGNNCLNKEVFPGVEIGLPAKDVHTCVKASMIVY